MSLIIGTYLADGYRQVVIVGCSDELVASLQLSDPTEVVALVSRRKDASPIGDEERNRPTEGDVTQIVKRYDFSFLISHFSTFHFDKGKKTRIFAVEKCIGEEYQKYSDGYFFAFMFSMF